MTAETDIAAIDDGGANTAAEVRTALTSVLGARAQGVLAYAERDTAQSGITTLTNIASLQLTFTPPVGRRLKITVYVPSLTSSVSGDRGIAHIDKDGATVQQRLIRFGGTNADAGLEVVFIDSPTNASHTYTARYERASGGTGSHTWTAGATQPSFILAEDIGEV